MFTGTEGAIEHFRGLRLFDQARGYDNLRLFEMKRGCESLV